MAGHKFSCGGTLLALGDDDPLFGDWKGKAAKGIIASEYKQEY